MNAADGSPYWSGRANPFPPAAVATFPTPPSEVLTIETRAVREVDDFIDSYLRAAEARDGAAGPGDPPGGLPRGTGRICVIEGNYGTGKTHLALEMIRHIDDAHTRSEVDTRVFYCIAPGGSFLALYKGLVEDVIGYDEVQRRVREFYADIVANALRDRPFTGELVNRLERGDVFPEDVIERLGLREGELREELRRRLSSVTQDEAFTRALVLLVRGDLNKLAWEWLVGGSPSQVIREQGIEKRISTDVQALDALGVIALLYGRKNRRFVLIIDEFENLATSLNRSDAGKVQAFKQLIEVFRAAGALLVVCGLPDIFNILPRDTNRLDKTIIPSGLTEKELTWYIEGKQAPLAGERTLEPFTPKSVGYLVSMTGGTAREVVQLCYYAFERAAATGNKITPTDISLVARQRMPNDGIERARAEIEDVLSEQGWPNEHSVAVSQDADTLADFWVPGDEPGTGCSVILSASILEEAPAHELADQLRALKSDQPRREVILVVSGYLPADLRPAFEDALGAKYVIVYRSATFARDFALVIGDALGRMTQIGAHSQERSLKAEFDRLARQQANTLRVIQDLAGRTEERFNGLQASVTTARRQEGTAGETLSRVLPAHIDEIFSTAENSLNAYGGDIGEFTSEAFTIAAQEPGATYSLVQRFRDHPDAFTGIGVATYLSDLLRAFRSSVEGWMRGLTTRPRAEALGATEQDRLQRICRAYEALFRTVPLYRLDVLAEVTTLVASGQERTGSVLSARREAVRRVLDGLGNRVYQAASDPAAWGDP
jgi:Cdc6-like AAA superfamily ATPase